MEVPCTLQCRKLLFLPDRKDLAPCVTHLCFSFLVLPKPVLSVPQKATHLALLGLDTGILELGNEMFHQLVTPRAWLLLLPFSSFNPAPSRNRPNPCL